MALSRTQKAEIINRFIVADDAKLFTAIESVCGNRHESPIPTTDEYYLQTESGCYFCEDFEDLWAIVLQENKAAVQGLRENGWSDEDIVETGYTLPENITNLSAVEDVMLIERHSVGGGNYLYRGMFWDGRYFFGLSHEKAHIIKDGIRPFALDWEDLFSAYGEDTTRSTADMLWKYALSSRRFEG